MPTVAKTPETKADPKMRDQVNKWLARHNLKVNADGKTVNLVKLVGADFKSTSYNQKDGSAVNYKIGQTAVATDYAPTPGCGLGLHFSPTIKMAAAAGGGGPKSIICSVDLESMIVIDHNKVKARSCLVLGEGTEKDLHKYNPDYIYTMLKAWA